MMLRTVRRAALMAIAASLAGVSGAAATGPNIALTPNSNHPSSTTQVNGSGFGDNEAVDLYFDTTDEELAVTNGSGAFPKTRVPVPANATPGAHYVTAVGRHSGFAAQKAFTVNTDWAQFHFNEKQRGLNAWENVLASYNVSSLDVAWTYTTGNAVSGSPVVVGGNVYICSTDGDLYSINATTGAENWLGGTGGGVCTGTPAVANGVVYIGSGTNGNGTMYALNASTGLYSCSYQTGGAINAAPTVANGIVYFGSEDGYLYAMGANGCGLIWKFQTIGAIDSSPAVANGMVFIGSSGGNPFGGGDFYGLNAYTGAQNWVVTGDSGGIETSPAVSNGLVYWADDYGTVYVVNAKSGRVVQSVPDGSSTGSSVAVANGVVYVGTSGGANGTVLALQANNLQTIWTFTPVDGTSFISSPAVANGVLYIGGEDGEIYALDAAEGGKLWTATTGNQVNSSPAVSNGMVYVGSNDNNVYAFALNAGNDGVYKSKRMPPPSVWSLHPDWSLKPAAH